MSVLTANWWLISDLVIRMSSFALYWISTHQSCRLISTRQSGRHMGMKRKHHRLDCEMPVNRPHRIIPALFFLT